MSVSYQAVGWNRTKKVYDSILAGGLLLYLGIFVGIGSVVHPNATAETLLIRGLGTAALLLLDVILCIGPLCRLDRRFLPLLYNRRHLGVTMFVLALAHGTFSIVQFHALGNVNPLISLFVSNTRYTTTRVPGGKGEGSKRWRAFMIASRPAMDPEPFLTGCSTSWRSHISRLPPI